MASSKFTKDPTCRMYLPSTGTSCEGNPSTFKRRAVSSASRFSGRFADGHAMTTRESRALPNDRLISHRVQLPLQAFSILLLRHCTELEAEALRHWRCAFGGRFDFCLCDWRHGLRWSRGGLRRRFSRRCRFRGSSRFRRHLCRGRGLHRFCGFRRHRRRCGALFCLGFASGLLGAAFRGAGADSFVGAGAGGDVGTGAAGRLGIGGGGGAEKNRTFAK